MYRHWAYFGLSPITIIILSYLIQILEFTLIFSSLRYIIYDHNYGVLESSVSYTARGHYLSITLIVHFLGQIVFTPLIGSLTDYFGRRKLILICMATWCICFLIGSFSIAIHSFALFVFSRLFGGSLFFFRPLVLSVISDLYANSYQRQRGISLFSACEGLGAAFYLFVVGRIVYGTLDPIGSPILYYLIAAGLAGFNFFLLYTNLPETLPITHPMNRYWPNFLGSFKVLLSNRLIYSRFFLLFFAYGALNFLIMSRVQHRLENQQFPISLFVKLFALGLVWTVSSLFLVPRLVKLLSPQRIFFYSLIYMLFLWAIAYWLPSWTFTIWEIALTGILAGVSWPVMLMLGTWQIPETLQGTVQGLIQLGFTITLAISVFLLNTDVSYEIYMLAALGFLIVSALLFFFMHFDPIVASPLESPPGSTNQFF